MAKTKKGAAKAKAKKGDVEAINTLAAAELEEWFVWDLLATPALEKAGHDRQAAIHLLALAIAELATRDESDMPKVE